MYILILQILIKYEKSNSIYIFCHIRYRKMYLDLDIEDQKIK